MYGAYAKTSTETTLVEWEQDENFRESIERYIVASATIMRSLDRQLREALPAGDVVVYGTGQLAMKLLTGTVLGERRIAAFADGNPVKAGQTFGGVPVVRPEDLARTAGASAAIVITTLLHTEGIHQRIAELGLPNPVLTLHA